MRKSLYIVSVPRTVSCIIHRIICTSIGYEYGGSTSGEYLNWQRIKKPLDGIHKKFMNKKLGFCNINEKHEVREMLEYIHKNYKGIVLKDVLYPDIMSRFVKKYKPNTIIVNKYIPDTAYSIVNKGWWGIADYAKNPNSDKELGVVDGLIRIKKDFFEPLLDIPNVKELKVRDFLNNSRKVFDILRDLGYDPEDIDYMKIPRMKRGYERVKKYRNTVLWHKLNKYYKKKVKK